MAPLPATTAAIVVGLEVLIGVLLLANTRPVYALALGVFLNVQFMLAGVVNPSVFYVILAFSIIHWRMEQYLSVERSRLLAKRVAVGAVVLSLMLVPFVSTMRPAMVMEDPALVIIFLAGLFAFGGWWTQNRIAAKVEALRALGYVRQPVI